MIDTNYASQVYPSNDTGNRFGQNIFEDVTVNLKVSDNLPTNDQEHQLQVQIKVHFFADVWGNTQSFKNIYFIAEYAKVAEYDVNNETKTYYIKPTVSIL